MFIDTVSIQGGQGALATMECAHRLIRAWSQRFSCTQDSDYPNVKVMSSNRLVVDSQGLIHSNIELLQGPVLVPCNTLYFQNLPENYYTPLGSSLQKWGDRDYIILSGRTVYEKNLPVAWEKIDRMTQRDIEQVIQLVIAGNLVMARNLFEQTTSSLKKPLLLACTELSCLGLPHDDAMYCMIEHFLEHV